jgi:hypothetical protein
MTAKEYLRQYEYAVKRIHRLETELEEETLLIDAVRSVSDNDGMPHGSGISKPTEERAIRLADKRLRLVQARLDAIEIRQEIYDAIEQVGGFEADVLFERHVRLDSDGSQQTWETICNKLYYSWPTVRLAYKAGLEKIDKYLQE